MPDFDKFIGQHVRFADGRVGVIVLHLRRVGKWRVRVKYNSAVDDRMYLMVPLYRHAFLHEVEFITAEEYQNDHD